MHGLQYGIRTAGRQMELDYLPIVARHQWLHKRDVRLGEWNRDFPMGFVLSALATNHSP
jgi:hypothetical protein